jgi:hypothetical protein
MPDTEWTSARKMIDYYMDQSEGIEAAQKRLYLAVIKGEVRARFKGRVYGPEWLKQIALMVQLHSAGSYVADAERPSISALRSYN